MNSISLPAWLKENFQRFKAASPTFFKIWGRINIVLLLVGGIPTALDWAQKVFEFNVSTILPHAYWLRVALRIVAACGAWGKIMNSLTVQSPIVGITPGGVPVKMTLTDMQPFTDAVEKKAAEKQQADVVDVTPVTPTT